MKEMLIEAESHASGLFTASRLAVFYSTPHHKEYKSFSFSFFFLFFFLFLFLLFPFCCY